MTTESPIRDGQLAAQISNTVVRALSRTTGRGPTKAKTTLGPNGVFVVLVMLAGQLQELGFIGWFSDQIASGVDGMSCKVAFVILSLVYFYGHYLFASNTAQVTAMYAAFLATAIAVGAPPELAALVLAFESSLFACLTHYATGPAPVLFGAGYVTSASGGGSAPS